MSVSIDVAWKSLNKYTEELCGDKVEILKKSDSDVVILSDGMGSGVKANILATLTSKILKTMFDHDLSIEESVETIAKTLPVCQVRGVAYSTFSILQIFHSGKAYLAELIIRPAYLSGMARWWTFLLRRRISKERKSGNIGFM